MNVPKSGNHLEDRFDEEMDIEAREQNELECGCIKRNCTCDAAWDDRD